MQGDPCNAPSQLFCYLELGRIPSKQNLSSVSFYPETEYVRQMSQYMVFLLTLHQILEGEGRGSVGEVLAVHAHTGT